MSLITRITLTLAVSIVVLLSVTSSAMTVAPPKCAVVGVGALGTNLCRQLLDEYSDATILGITRSDTRHGEIQSQIDNDRLVLSTIDQCLARGEKYENVVYCAPPSGSEDYAADVKRAIDNLWQGPDSGGVFVFTSSGAVYGPGDTSTVDEDSPTADPESSPRIARLIHSEKHCLNAGGTVLRLAGLYSLERGPHNYWLTSGNGVKGSPDGLINFLHYEDAAGVCLAAIKAGYHGKVFLISDGHPLSRRDLCTSALKAKPYQQYSMPQFESQSGEPWALGKVYNGKRSNAALHWQPRYKSFDEYMTSQA